jgi:hypothetical protein
LAIDATQEFQVAVGAQPSAIAGAQQPCSRGGREWVRHEPLAAALREIAVTPRQADAAEVEFARGAQGRRLQVRVEHERLGVGDRPPDGQAAGESIE